MAMIKCSECGKDISDKAAVCIGCGAPIASVIADSTSIYAGQKVGDLNGDGKIDFEDFKIALSRSKQYAADKIEATVKLGKQKLQSAKEKDTAAVVELAKSFETAAPVEQTASQINRSKFQSALASTIDVRFAEIMASKKETEAYLTYIDAQILTAKVRGIFKNVLNVTPPQAEAACLLSEAVLAPSMQEKQKLIKASVGVSGGAAGIGVVIGAIGSALGWGAPALMGAVTFFKGATIAGPIGWGVAGLSLAAIAGYFASTSNNQTDTERFLRVLKSSTARAVDAIWEQYETELSNTVTQAASSDAAGTK
ncbi:MAG: hypothetical protein ABI475_03745 [Methylophilaceae bacterium]